MEPRTAGSTGLIRRRALAVVVGSAAIAAGFVPAATGVSASAPPADNPYCQAHLDAEAAATSGDPELTGPAFEAALAAIPDDLRPALQTVIDSGGDPTNPDFDPAYAQILDYLSAECGFAELEVLATDYAYGGIPEDVPAGPTIMRLTNGGEEVHEMVLVRRLEGADDPVEELLAMPDDEVFTKIEFVGFALAMPGASSGLVADLTPGRYIVVCFLPVGATPEAFAEMMAAGEEPPLDGSAAEAGTMPMESMPMESTPMESMPTGTEPPNHASEGMVFEFTVS
jgi:hypothetical protein